MRERQSTSWLVALLVVTALVAVTATPAAAGSAAAGGQDRAGAGLAAAGFSCVELYALLSPFVSPSWPDPILEAMFGHHCSLRTFPT